MNIGETATASILPLQLCVKNYLNNHD